MWVFVLAANVIAVVLAICLPLLDQHLGDRDSLPIAAGAVQAIFGALAGGMITFTGIVFSAVFVAAQIQTTSYSPRLAARLRRDPVVIAGLALPTATAVYSLFALASIGRQTDRFGPTTCPLSRCCSACCSRWSRSARSWLWSSARSRTPRSAASCARSCAAATR